MKGLLGKFYVSKIYRKSGFEEKCLIEILKFAFDIMSLEKLLVFVNEQNQYFYKLLQYAGFRLIKMKPKTNGQHNRLMLSITKEDFDAMMKKNFKKLMKNKFYNSFLMEAYRDGVKSSAFNCNSEQLRSNKAIIMSRNAYSPKSEQDLKKQAIQK